MPNFASSAEGNLTQIAIIASCVCGGLIIILVAVLIYRKQRLSSTTAAEIQSSNLVTADADLQEPQVVYNSLYKSVDVKSATNPVYEDVVQSTPDSDILDSMYAKVNKTKSLINQKDRL